MVNEEVRVKDVECFCYHTFPQEEFSPQLFGTDLADEMSVTNVLKEADDVVQKLKASKEVDEND